LASEKNIRSDDNIAFLEIFPRPREKFENRCRSASIKSDRKLDEMPLHAESEMSAWQWQWAAAHGILRAPSCTAGQM
jgi:hypothetical protein